MLKKSRRIHSKEFAIIPKGVLKTTPYFDVRISKGSTLKVACVVKTKLFKTAVARNKARRRMYQIAEECLEKNPGFYIFYPKQTIGNVTFKVLKQTLDSLLY